MNELTKPTTQKIAVDPKNPRLLLLDDGRPVLTIIGGGHINPFTLEEIEQIIAAIRDRWNVA